MPGPSDHVCAGSFRRGGRKPHIGWMRVLVIYCHPVAESFAASAHAVVLEALAERDHEVTDVDLYAEQFDPVMSRQERLDYQNTARNERLVKRYDDQIATTEAIVLVYPAWWYGMPAMLKGYFDRVWAPGIAFERDIAGGRIRPLLTHIKLFGVVTTYGSPWWITRLVAGDLAARC